jgi:hypothetical protein
VGCEALSQMFFPLSAQFTQISGAFSGLLSAAIENMNGIGGRPGWAWIFILVLFGIFIYLLQFSTTP